MSVNVLDIQKVSKSFPGIKALNKVSLQVRTGTVHTIMGENGAGKSTLMKCLIGLYQPDEGTIFIQGKPLVHFDVSSSLHSGISMIHQELANVPERSVMENLWLGREKIKNMIRPITFLKILDFKQTKKETQALLDEFGLDFSPATLMKDLSLAKQQFCEIIKAISYSATIIIMDEPTSSLSELEVDQLFQTINKLRNSGVSVIYISHKMAEIFRISDDISIMRDGELVGTWQKNDLNEALVIKHMVGRSLSQRFPSLPESQSEIRLKVENLADKNGKFRNISFHLHKGEILGIGGLEGAGKSEIVEALFGLREPLPSSRLELDGKAFHIRHPKDAIDYGFGMITEDRKKTGIFSVLSIVKNATVSSLEKFMKCLFILNNKKIQNMAIKINDKISTKYTHPNTLIGNLSGGNQQKVIISRCLLTDPSILIMDEPTRGIDIGAKYEIYLLMIDLIKQGKSIIMISSEMPELISMSHRILVLCQGENMGILKKPDFSQEKIMGLAANFN